MSIKIGVVIHEDPNGRMLVPATPFDVIEMGRLDPAATYTFVLSKMRNYLFHKKFFAMIDIVWENMLEEIRAAKGINSIDMMLLQVKLAVGHCDYLYVEEYESFCLIPKSISFAEMDQNDFEKFYNKVLRMCIERWMPQGVTDYTSWEQMINDGVNRLIGFV